MLRGETFLIGRGGSQGGETKQFTLTSRPETLLSPREKSTAQRGNVPLENKSAKIAALNLRSVSLEDIFSALKLSYFLNTSQLKKGFSFDFKTILVPGMEPASFHLPTYFRL